MSLFNELKRRNVFRIGAAYVVTAWLIIQVVETIFPAFGFGDAAVRIVVIVLAIGIIPALILAWAFELTSQGLKKETDIDRSLPASPKAGKNLDRAIMMVLALALSFFAFDKFVLDPSRDESRVEAARQEGRTEALVESFGDKSIAVLPFVNMSSDPEQEYFSDGITEELLSLLARIPELRVISRSSSFTFKGKEIDITQVAEQLNVSHILEGSVRKAGNQVRITAQLIDARSDTPLWSETWDRALGDIFAIQDEIASDVVKQLNVTLLNPVPRGRQTHPEAYAKTLRAKYLLQARGPGDFMLAADLLKEALALDPDYVPALTHSSMVYFRMYQQGVYSLAEARRLGDEALIKALSIAPDDGLANAYRAWDLVEWSDVRDLDAAAAMCQKAVESEPGNAEVLMNVGKCARWIGRHDDALALIERAMSLDPLCFACIWNRAKIYTETGRLKEAEEEIRKYMGLGSGGGYSYGKISLMLGEPAIALEVFEGEDINEVQSIAGRAMALNDLERKTESDAALAELIERWGEEKPRDVADVYAWTGDVDAAFEWLEKAYGPDLEGSFRVFFNPVYHHLHDDLRWNAMREKVGFSEERLEAIEFEVNLPD